MKHIKLFEQFINESFYGDRTIDNKKPTTVFTVSKMSYDDLHKVVDPKWGQISLPTVDANLSGDYTIHMSDDSKSAMESRYRKAFENWKSSVVKKWGNDVKIFVWNTHRNKLIFKFMSGSSKALDNEMQRRLEIKPSQDYDDAVGQYYSDTGNKRRYFGD
jgi:hypothetical protein